MKREPITREEALEVVVPVVLVRDEVDVVFDPVVEVEEVEEEEEEEEEEEVEVVGTMVVLAHVTLRLKGGRETQVMLEREKEEFNNPEQPRL